MKQVAISFFVDRKQLRFTVGWAGLRDYLSQAIIVGKTRPCMVRRCEIFELTKEIVNGDAPYVIYCFPVNCQLSTVN